MVNGIESALNIPSINDREESSPIKVNINNSDSSQDTDAVAVELTEQQSTSGASLDISQEASNSQIAEQAANDVFELRRAQLERAEEADDSANPTRRAELQSDIENLQAEIERIATEAVDANGNSVLSSSSVTLSNDEVVARADLRSISDDPNVDVSTEAGAEAAVSSLEDIVSTAFRQSQTASSALGDIQTVLAREVEVQSTQRANNEEAIQNEEEAARIANQISNQIVERFGSAENPAQSLTDTLISSDPNTEVLTSTS